MVRHRWWIAVALSMALAVPAMAWAAETGPLRKELDPSEPAGARDPAFDLLWSVIDAGGGISESEGIILVGTITTGLPVVTGVFALDGDAAAGSLATDASATSLDGPITEFALAPVMPTPNRGVATISWALPRQSNVRLVVYDVQGREVAVLANGPYEPGRHSVTWRATDRGRGVAGVYFIRLHAADRVMMRRTVVTP